MFPPVREAGPDDGTRAAAECLFSDHLADGRGPGFGGAHGRAVFVAGAEHGTVGTVGAVAVRCLEAHETAEYLTEMQRYGVSAATLGVGADDRVGTITHVVVEPAARRQGVGGALLRAGFAYLTGTGCDVVAAAVPQAPGAALTLFSREGFRRVATLRGVPHAPGCGPPEGSPCRACDGPCRCVTAVMTRRARPAGRTGPRRRRNRRRAVGAA